MMNDMIEKFAGCLLGLALGDALGAPREGGPIERFVWRMIGRTRAGHMRWTDDTQMSLDLAESLISKGCLDLDDVAARFARSYRWRRGYGPGATKLLKRVARGAAWRDANCSVYPDGSFGNGGAMRAPVVGLFYSSRLSQLLQGTRDSARITHAHPLGLEGAVLIAAGTAKALVTSKPAEIFDFAAAQCELKPVSERLELAREWLYRNENPTPREVSKRLGKGVGAVDSCVTALYVGMRFLHRSFDELQTFVGLCGGDVDTIGAMSGALWGAARGSADLPDAPLRVLEDRERIKSVAEALYKVSMTEIGPNNDDHCRGRG
jgi:ADP-ribosylglycohydrolase